MVINLYIHLRNEPQVDRSISNTLVMKLRIRLQKLCTNEILFAVFYIITCATKLHVEHLSVPCKENYTCDVIIMYI